MRKLFNILSFLSISGAVLVAGSMGMYVGNEVSTIMAYVFMALMVATTIVFFAIVLKEMG